MSYETVRRWVNDFGPMIAADLRKRRLRPRTTWHLDEVYPKIDGRVVYLGGLWTPKARSSMCWSRPSEISTPRPSTAISGSHRQPAEWRGLMSFASFPRSGRRSCRRRTITTSTSKWSMCSRAGTRPNLRAKARGLRPGRGRRQHRDKDNPNSHFPTPFILIGYRLAMDDLARKANRADRPAPTNGLLAASLFSSRNGLIPQQTRVRDAELAAPAA